MTNTTSRQATINANNASKALLTENNADNAKNAAVSTNKVLNGTAEIVLMPKRYSFDDNGGGYKGL